VAIEAYSNELNRRHELEVELEISPELPRLTEDAEVALFNSGGVRRPVLESRE
jgi:hypothetical protein